MALFLAGDSGHILNSNIHDDVLKLLPRGSQKRRGGFVDGCEYFPLLLKIDRIVRVCLVRLDGHGGVKGLGLIYHRSPPSVLILLKVLLGTHICGWAGNATPHSRRTKFCLTRAQLLPRRFRLCKSQDVTNNLHTTAAMCAWDQLTVF